MINNNYNHRDLRYIVRQSFPGDFDHELYGYADGHAWDAYHKAQELTLDEHPSSPTTYWVHDRWTGQNMYPRAKEEYDKLWHDVDVFLAKNLTTPPDEG